MSTANIITVIRLALIPFFVLFMELDGSWALFAAACIFALASITDHLDGYIARKYNQITDLGKILDPLADKLLVFAAFVLFVADGLMHPLAILIILARELTITSIRVVAASNGRIVGAAFSGKLKTVVQITVILIVLILPLLPEIGIDVFTEHYVLIANILCWLTAAVTLWSGIDYCLHGLSLKNLKK